MIEKFDTGITNEVFTIKSNIVLLDIFNEIINKKALACYNWALNFDKKDKVIIIGAYLTGIGIAKKFLAYFDEIILIDIYEHLVDFINFPIGSICDEKSLSKIVFSTDIDLIYEGDIIIDTTGFGGISEEQSSKLDVKAFLIEDPIAEDNDILLNEKNNIYKRLNLVKSPNKAVLKTKGINTKTSGTMTLTVGVLSNSLTNALSIEGVLYAICEMRFFEELIFKTKDLNKFFNIVNKKAMKISTINIFDCDEIIKEEINSINSHIIFVD